MDNMEGLGDVVEYVATKTGLKRIVSSVVDDCGCQKRKEALNKAIPFNNKQ